MEKVWFDSEQWAEFKERTAPLSWRAQQDAHAGAVFFKPPKEQAVYFEWAAASIAAWHVKDADKGAWLDGAPEAGDFARLDTNLITDIFANLNRLVWNLPLVSRTPLPSESTPAAAALPAQS